MILGYFLIDKAGTPLIVRDFYPIFREELKQLVPAIISAVNSMTREVLEAEVQEIKTDKGVLYIGASKDYVLIIFTDTESTTNRRILREMMGLINSSGYDIEELQYDDIKLEILRSELDDIIRGSPIIVSEILELNKMLKGLLSLEKNLVSLPKISIKPGKMKVKTKGFLGRKKYQGLGVSDALKALEKGELEKALGISKTILDEDPNNELARLIYVKSAIILNKTPPHVEAPDLDETIKICDGVADKILKQYLLAEINAIKSLEGLFDKYATALKYYNDILKYIEGNDEKAKISAIIFHDVMIPSLLERIIFKFSDDSPFYYETLFYLEYMKIYETKIMDASEWLKKYHDLMSILNELNEIGSENRIYIDAILSLHMAKILLTKDVAEDEIKSLFEESIKRITEGCDYIMAISKSMIPSHIRLNLFYHGKIVPLKAFYFLDLISNKNEIIEKLKTAAKTALDYLMGIRDAGRDEVIHYIILASKLLEVYSSILAFENKTAKEVPEIIDEILSYDIGGLGQISKPILVEFYYKIVATILNAAMGTSSVGMKKTVIKRGLELLYMMLGMVKDIPYVYLQIIADMLRIVYMMQDIELDLDLDKLLQSEEIQSVLGGFIKKKFS